MKPKTPHPRKTRSKRNPARPTTPLPNLKNKTILLRIDINSDVVNGKVKKSERIKPTAETIKFLKAKKAKIIILAHQGNPKKSDFTSLKQHAKFLNKQTKIKFLNQTISKKAEQEIKNLKPRQAILLENIRFIQDEFHPEKPKNKIVKFFKPLIDIYINDAFSVCHRNQTSIISFPYYAGPNLEKELQALKKLKQISNSNCLYILGGAKPEDNLKLLKKTNKILAAGIFGQLCVEAKGTFLGKNNRKINNKIAKDYSKLLKNPKLKNTITPIDYAVKVGNKRKELFLKKFPTPYIVYDIGKKTQQLFTQEIKKARAVYMKGPAGFCGYKNFCAGTNAILKAIAQNKKCFSIIGGGHLSDAIKKSKIPESKFSHFSLSGGALLRYLAGEKLPGLTALR